MAQETKEIGPLHLQPAATLYLLKPQDSHSSVHVSAFRGSRDEGERLLVRAFDPSEHTSFWQFSEPGRNQAMIDSENARTSNDQRQAQTVRPKNGELIYSANIPFAAAGVHQVRFVGGARNSNALLSVPAGTEWGITFQKGDWSPWKGQPKRMYLYIPPHSEVVVFSGGPIRMFDDRGALVAETKMDDVRDVTSVPVARTDVVWEVEFPTPEKWNLRASAGFPFILCSSQEAARTIRGSVEILSDGTVVAWKFQRRIHELLPTVLSAENVGRAEDLLFSISDREADWLGDAERNIHLLGPSGLFSGIHRALLGQSVDPQSHWAGAMIGGDGVRTWKDLVDKRAPENRWDRLRSLPDLQGGITPHSSGPVVLGLAAAALLNAPFNPWYGRRELLWRAAAASLADLQGLSESEAWPGDGDDLDPYPAGMAFAAGQKTFPVYPLVAPSMPQEVREVWTEGLRHIVDRWFAEELTTARNQSSHFPFAWQLFANGSGEPRYRDIARSQASRFVEGQSPAGYHMERMGPDASYIGMTHWHLAMYFRQSGGDPVVLDSLRRSYRFFNHTVAPEPDGNMLGGVQL